MENSRRRLERLRMRVGGLKRTGVESTAGVVVAYFEYRQVNRREALGKAVLQLAEMRHIDFQCN